MKRIRDGIRVAVVSATIFCVFISLLVFGFARPLMLIFVPVHETEIISIGVQYLRIEGAFIAESVACSCCMVSIGGFGNRGCRSC